MDETQKILVALGYPIWIIALIMAIVEKKDKDVKYHAFQALFFGIAFIVIWIVLWIVFTILTVATFGILGFMFLLLPIVWLIYIIMAIVYAVKAYKGEKFKVPFVHKFAYNIAYK
ncbi:DUF4870 domain-containing protein [Candidatus Woesearchaeota archaeon]|nr:DUF4870 domain-containing protein [Candidatus Woesearchaeota archaeon]